MEELISCFTEYEVKNTSVWVKKHDQTDLMEKRLNLYDWGFPFA